MLTLAEDKLGRTNFINNLFSLFENFGNQGDCGFTMILNGKYGSGKTTVLGFINERNGKEKKFDIVNYNAWENNLFDNPLIPILYEISKLKKKNEKLGSKIKAGAIKVARALPKIFTGTLANAHGIDLTPLTDDDLDIFREYDDYRKSIDDFRQILTEYSKDKKVLFLVDELDRCLPEYQIKVLEAIHHLFGIPNLIVVIALDKQQLECSIKNKFGDAQNTLGYLSKFINYQVDLPDETKSGFVQSLMKFECDGSGYETGLAKSFIFQLFEIMGYSVRECQRVVDEINLICNRVNDDGEPLPYYYWYPILIAIIVIVKHSNEGVYKRWFYTAKEANYRTEKIKYSESPVYQFFADVIETNVGPIFSFIKNTDKHAHVAKPFLIHFINAFCPIGILAENELEKELNINANSLKHGFYDGMRYPYHINEAINKVKMLRL